MKSKNCASVVGMLGLVVIALGSFGCGAGTPPPVISVSVSPVTATVQAGATTQITATVTNDSTNKGVTWSVSCPTAPCGAVSPVSTASGAATTYTAPPNPPLGGSTVTITATSMADSSKLAPATITIPPTTLSVFVMPPTATVQVGATAPLTATVINDAANKGVTWTVSCSTAPCGIVSPATTASGISTTYTAPTTPPAGDLAVTITATSATDTSVTGSAKVTVPGINISIAPGTATVLAGATLKFTATVSNDPSNGGVTWSLQKLTFRCTLVCHLIFSPCPSACGSVSPAATASAEATTYTAPVKPPPPHGVFLVATSVTNTGAFSREEITVLPISVSVAPTSPIVPVNATQQFSATVTNDGTNSGVTWTLTQNGTACSPSCGTINPASTASGANVTYTAPAVVPPLPLVMLTATSVANGSTAASATITITTSTGAACGASSGSESLLKGRYAFMLLGSHSNGVVGIAGSFTADGLGKVVVGEEDSNSSATPQIDAMIDATRSSYSVGPDHRGCLALAITNGGTTYFRFALGSVNSGSIATKGHLIEFDDTNGKGTRLTGTLGLQDATSFVATQFKGNYVVGLDGSLNNSRLAIAGTFTSDGISVITASDLDINNGGAVTTNIASAPGGSFTCCSANGRGTLQINAGSFTSSVVAMYMISSSDVFLVNTGFGQYAGEAIGIPSPTTFSQASLNGSAVLRKTAQSSTGPIVDVALATANGSGGINIADNTNNAGTFSSGTTAFTYTVASNGRVTLMGGTKPPVLYLYGQNAGFLMGTDTNVEFGVIEPQAAGPFSNASLSGAYMFGTENPSAITVALDSGVATLDGVGNVAGTSDQSSSAVLAQNQNVSLTYSVAAGGTGTFGTGTTAILVSVNKLVFINNTSTTPTITVVEK